MGTGKRELRLTVIELCWLPIIESVTISAPGEAPIGIGHDELPKVDVLMTVDAIRPDCFELPPLVSKMALLAGHRKVTRGQDKS